MQNPTTRSVALVTGAAHRVGKAIALRLAQEGMDILLHYRSSPDAATQTAEQIRAQGVQCVTVQADLADSTAPDVIFGVLEESFGRLDLLVNSASAFQVKGLMDITADDWDHTMNVNLRAPFLLGQAAARIMGEQGDGVIINISDIAGQVPWVRFPHHSVSKAGLIMLTRVMAKSFAPTVRVNAIVPGPILKPDAMPDARWQELSEHLPMKRSGTPHHVAEAVLALAHNDFITGAVLNVDGGDSLIGSIDID